MELRHIRYFIAVAEHLNFTKAAEQLHITQPPLSFQIRQFEKEIGVQLFVRSQQRVELTDAGRHLLQEARILMSQATHFLDVAEDKRKNRAGVVKIGISWGLVEHLNPALISHAKRFPDVEIRCKDLLSGLQNEALRKKQIDVGFLRPPIDSELLSETLFRERFVALLSAKDPLSRSKKVTLKELSEQPLLLHPRNISSGTYDKIIELYKNAGVTPSVNLTSTGFYEQAGILLVASGKGIYLGVGAPLKHPWIGSGVVAVLLDEPGATMDVCIAWRKEEDSPATLQFISSMRPLLRRR